MKSYFDAAFLKSLKFKTLFFQYMNSMGFTNKLKGTDWQRRVIKSAITSYITSSHLEATGCFSHPKEI